jgi:uncharacterized repeat protein (TIGR01451 family)
MRSICRRRYWTVFALVAITSGRMMFAACPDFSGTSVPAGTYLFGIASGDFNGDGHVDFVVGASGLSGSYKVATGDGSGGFSFGPLVATPSTPDFIATGDFNRDGKLDFVTANTNTDSISIFLGNGNGTFAPTAASPISTGISGPNGIAVGDISGDGKPDLAVANRSGSNVAILLGDGTGAFTAGTAVTAGVLSPGGVVFADLNRDGKLDLVVQNNQSNVLALAGDGAGGFPTPLLVGPTAGHSGTYDAVADLNRDGRLDIVEVDFGHNDVKIFLQNAGGSFDAPVPYAVGQFPVAVAIADYNGDGTPDLAVTNFFSDSVSVLTGAGNGTFAAAANFGTGGRPFTIVSADFNGDGRPDIAIPNNSSGQDVSVLLNTGDCAAACGLFTPTSFTADTGASSVATADFNRDGVLDLAVTNGGLSTVSILLGNTNGSFGAKNDLTVGAAPAFVATADFNADGKLDVAVVNKNSNTVSVLLGAGNGTFAARTASTDFTVGTLPITSPSTVAIGDFNRDGKPDMAVTCTASAQLTILLNTTIAGSSTPSFSLPATTLTAGPAGGPYGVTAADFDGDGNLDLAVTDRGIPPSSGTVQIFHGSATGAFSLLPNTIGVHLTPQIVVAADFNRDGKLDLAVANASSNDISILIGDGLGGFATAVNYAAGAGTQSVAAGDFDGDGKLDLATANFSGTMSILTGSPLPSGAGTFGAPKNYTSATARFVATGDFNRDGNLDVVVAESGSASNNVVVFKNTCADLSVTKSHVGDFVQGQVGATYTITVSNAPTGVQSVGNVTVTDTLPPGFTATTVTGNNWSCTLGTPVTTCTRSDSLSLGASYDSIQLNVTIAHDAGGGTNNVTVAGRGDPSPANNTYDDLTTVETGLATPTGLVGQATSESAATVQWDAVAGAVGYRLYRSDHHQPFQIVATLTPAQLSYPDSGLASGTTYVYMVDAAGSSNDFSATSNPDLATTILFAHSIVADTTVITAADMIELENAVGAVVAAATGAAATFPNPTGQPVLAADVTDLRNALDAARLTIGVPAISYTDPPPASGDKIKATHFLDLRSGVQ